MLPFLALYLTRSLGYPLPLVGLLLAVFGAGSVTAAVLRGLLADRLGRRPTLLGAQLATALFTVLLGFVSVPAVMAVNVAAFGIAINLSNPAMRAMVADIVPVERRSRAFAVTDWAGATVAPSRPCWRA